MNHIIMFHGQECPHCHVMMPRVLKLEKELGIKIEKLEVWHDDKNAAKMRSYAKIIKKDCDNELGTPAFVNVEKNKAICGEMSYNDLKLWATK